MVSENQTPFSPPDLLLLLVVGYSYLLTFLNKVLKDCSLSCVATEVFEVTKVLVTAFVERWTF